jgi:hypothetical protein
MLLPRTESTAAACRSQWQFSDFMDIYFVECDLEEFGPLELDTAPLVTPTANSASA